MNPLRIIQDSLKIRRAAKELYAVLLRVRPKGLELSRDPEVEAAFARVLHDHPEVTIVKTDMTITLVLRDDLDPTISPSTKTALHEAGMLVNKDTKHHG